MSTDQKPQHQRSILTAAISLIAVAISVASALFQFHVTRDSSNRQAIADAYAAWLEVSRMQIDYSDVVHLFALGDGYRPTCDLVRENAARANLANASMLLRERGVALYIFTLFEANLYQWDQARAVGDPRADFYKAVLDYQTGRQLRNPRLLYWWENGGLSNYFEAQTKDYFQSNVYGSAKHDRPKADAQGCFPPTPPTAPMPLPSPDG